MNYSNSFRNRVRGFLEGHNSTRYWQNFCPSSITSPSVFAYLIPRSGFTPVYTIPDNRSVIRPLYNSTYPYRQPELREIKKAEDILVPLSQDIIPFKLGSDIFYAARGMVFDANKKPILLVCRRIADLKAVLCIDYSVLQNQDAPMNRFIVRKLLPYIISCNTEFLFTNCSVFVVKPTFQGELDTELVKNFLVGKIDIEYKILHAESRG